MRRKLDEEDPKLANILRESIRLVLYIICSIIGGFSIFAFLMFCDTSDNNASTMVYYAGIACIIAIVILVLILILIYSIYKRYR